MHELDMKPQTIGNFYVDIGYGRLEVVNSQVAGYIYRLRSIIRNAGISENPRKQKERQHEFTGPK